MIAQENIGRWIACASLLFVIWTGASAARADSVLCSRDSDCGSDSKDYCGDGTDEGSPGGIASRGVCYYGCHYGIGCDSSGGSSSGSGQSGGTGGTTTEFGCDFPSTTVHYPHTVGAFYHCAARSSDGIGGADHYSCESEHNARCNALKYCAYAYGSTPDNCTIIDCQQYGPNFSCDDTNRDDTGAAPSRPYLP